MKTVFERMAESIDREAQANAWMATEKLGEDGLLHCTVCGGPRQCVITLFGEQKVVRCDCGCRSREDEAAKEVLRKQAIERHRRDCFRGSEATRCRFENDNGHNPELSTTARKYVENFAEYRRKGKGLVLYGPVGTGKYSQGGTRDSLSRSTSVDWSGNIAELPLGFNLSEDITSIFLMYGTPKMPPVNGLYAAMYGPAAQRTAKKKQEEAVKTILERLGG